MHWLNEVNFAEVITPAGVGTDSILTLNLGTVLGIPASWFGAKPIILERVNASGVNQSVTETATLSASGVLTINEGTNGFIALHVYRILLVNGKLEFGTATSAP
jgi:hypothetical protein